VIPRYYVVAEREHELQNPISVEEWLGEHADDPAVEDVRSMHEHGKRAHLRYGRDVLGWALFVCRVPSHS
jgi:hypothetical protein